MESYISICIISIALFQLIDTGETFAVNIKKDGQSENRVSKVEGKDKDVPNTGLKKRTNEENKSELQKKMSTETLDEEIEELLYKLKAAERLNIAGVTGQLKRVKRGWWFCPWCDGSKLIAEIAETYMKCTCSYGKQISCKCPDNRIYAEPAGQQEESS